MRVEQSLICASSFNPSIDAAVKKFSLDRLKTKLEYLSKHDLAKGNDYLVNNTFSCADAYLYIVLTWMAHLKIDLTPYPLLAAYLQRIAALDFVKSAHAAMNAIKSDK